MVIVLKEKQNQDGEKKFMVEMEIEDFMNIANLITTNRNDVSEVSLETLPSIPPMPTATMLDSSLDLPVVHNRVSDAVVPCERMRLRTRLSPRFCLQSLLRLQDDEKPSLVGSLPLALGCATAVGAMLLPNAAALLKLATSGGVLTGPIQLHVHNKARFWEDFSWDPNAYFAEQGVKEKWANWCLLPSGSLFGVAAWIVWSHARAESDSNLPLNFSLGVFLATLGCHWANFWIVEIRTGLFARAATTVGLTVSSFAFQSWSSLAFWLVVPSFVTYSYLTGVTYKTHQRWRRHRQAIEGWDDEQENNNNNRRNEVEIEEWD